MSDKTTTEWLLRARWQRWLIWGLFALVVYQMRSFFFIAFITFLLCYLVRTIVESLSHRFSPADHQRVWLDRGLTLATFLAMSGTLVGAALWIGPQFVQQSRTLLAKQQGFDPQVAFQAMLSRSVGAVLMHHKIGNSKDARFQSALKEYEAKARHGEGWYAQFPALASHLKSGFEARYEQQEQQRIDLKFRQDAAIGSGAFDQWFLRVKAPELFAQHRDTYLAQWAAHQPKASTIKDEVGSKPTVDFELQRDQQIGQRILRDVKADPVTFTDRQDQWQRTLVAQHWLSFQQSPEYKTAFREYYQQRHEAKPKGIPFSYKTYLALREAYPDGKEAFSGILASRFSTQPSANQSLLQQDFELATRQQLTHAWWADDPLAAALREHASESLPHLASVVGERLERLIRGLLTLPTQLATALLLTLFICFDMLHLRESLGRLRDSRIGNIYSEIVPGLVVFARLIGRSFSAQSWIAVFNTMLTFFLLWLLGIENSLLLCLFVFVGSFIPVMGVLLSGFPIAFQAMLQPDGSLLLALQAIAGVLLIHLIETSFLSPRIVGKVLHLHPVMVLVILVIGEHFFGIWGLLLGVPVAVYLFRVVLLQEAIPGIYQPPGHTK